MGRFFQPHWAYVAQIWVVGLARWLHQRRYTPFFGKSDKWAQAFIDLIEEKGVTDIVLYGDTRPIHASAVKEAKRRGLGVNVLKEGYMRLFWITSEQGGNNGNSRLIDMTIPQMQNAFSNYDMETPLPLHAGAICAITYFTGLYIIGSLFFGMATIAISTSISA
jgi:capsular polysaccharide export protein